MESPDAAFGSLEEKEESVLDNLRFRRLAIARGLVLTAQYSLQYGLLIIVVKETDSGIHSSLLLLSFLIPSVLTGLFSGALADHLPKKLVMVGADLLRAAIAVAFFFEADNVWKIYGITMALAAAGELRGPAEQAVVPSVVQYRQLASANAFFNITSTAGQALGMGILAALFLKITGPAPLYLVAASLFATGALLVTLIARLEPSRPPQDEAQQATHGVGKHLQAAWSVLRDDRVSYLAVLNLVLISTAVLTLVTLISRFMNDVLSVNAENAIFVFAPAALGLLAGIRLAPVLARNRSNAVAGSMGFVTFVLLLPILSFVPELGATVTENAPLGTQTSRILVTAMLAAPLGFAFSLTGITARAVLHERAPAAMRGRIFAATGVLISISSIIPLLVAGALADLFGIRAVVLMVTTATMAAAIYGHFWHPHTEPTAVEAA